MPVSLFGTAVDRSPFGSERLEADRDTRKASDESCVRRHEGTPNAITEAKLRVWRGIDITRMERDGG